MLKTTKKIKFHTFLYPSKSCTHFEQQGTLYTIVQFLCFRRVSTLIMYSTILESIPSILINLFLGQWSDRHGFKIPMLLPFVGFVVAQMILIANVLVETARAEYILVYTVYAFFGGEIGIIQSNLDFIES